MNSAIMWYMCLKAIHQWPFKGRYRRGYFLHSLVVLVINNSVLQLLNLPSLSTHKYLKLTSLYTIVVLRRTLQASFYMASSDCKPLSVKGSQSWQAYSKWGQMHVQWIVSKVLVSAQLYKALIPTSLFLSHTSEMSLSQPFGGLGTSDFEYLLALVHICVMWSNHVSLDDTKTLVYRARPISRKLELGHSFQWEKWV